MFPGVYCQWSEIGMNGVEKVNNGNRWQPIRGIWGVFPACWYAVGT